jgi:hypothetical protein
MAVTGLNKLNRTDLLMSFWVRYLSSKPTNTDAFISSI